MPETAIHNLRNKIKASRTRFNSGSSNSGFDTAVTDTRYNHMNNYRCLMTEHSICVKIYSSGKEDTTVDIVSALLRQRRKQSKRRKRRNIVTAKLGYACI